MSNVPAFTHRRLVDLKNSQSSPKPPVSHARLLVTDLRKSFLAPAGERIEVLRGVTFSVCAGETIAIVGPSGAGKSTLLHLLGGIEAPDHGSIVLDEFEVHRMDAGTAASYRNRQIGFLFQFHHLLGDLSAVENVSLPLRLARHDPNAAVQVARGALDRLGLSARADHRVTDLSGGEQQRVAVCRALIARPRLVLADEPTGNLDAVSAGQVASDLLSYAAARPALLVIATHNPALAEQCDRTFVLAGGKMTET